MIVLEKVSVIIPVYNVHNYLKFCINSVINQSYSNLEIILVDDGSTDGSSVICDNYAKEDKRVKVYHKKNEGVSLARNYGVKKSTGNYIIFVDSDDFVHKEMIKTLVDLCEKKYCDMAACSYLRINVHNVMEPLDISGIVKKNTREEFYETMICDSNIAGYVWNKLYKTKIIKQMSNLFLDYIFEDFEFNCRYLELCDSICYTTQKLYYYYVNNYGITGTFKINEKIINGIKAYTAILNYYDKYCTTMADLVAFAAFKYTLNLNYRSFVLENSSKNKFLNTDLYNRVKKSRKLSFSKKVYAVLSQNFPIVTSRLKFKINKWGKKA